MKMIRGTLKLALILYICATLSGVYVLSASARITPHDGGDDTMLITIEKGDTLWDLCQEYLKDPLQWRELSKYNDFTNPHLIYPGEKLRIPIAMAKDAVEVAEADLAKQQEELQNLRAELAESEATWDKLEAEIKALNASMDELKAKLNELQEASAAETKKQFTDLQGEIEKPFTDLKAETEKQFTDLMAEVEKASEGNKKQVESLQGKLKVTDEHIATLQADVKTLLTQIETNQKAINEAVMILKNAQGVHEEPSTAKRALVFLTTAAAGIGWFAISMIGGRSGE